MNVRFSDPVLAESATYADFPGAIKVALDNKQVVATIDDRVLTLATVEANRHLIIFTVNPQAYAHIHKCQVPDKPMRFYQMWVSS